MATTATTTKTITIHDRCRVAPPYAGEAIAEQSLPLTFFDMIWLHFHPIQRLLFYPLSCSTSNFIETIVPNLKRSLSTTLINYLPMAGNLLYPLLDSGMPEIRYVPGDSVCLTIAEASEAFDFNYLTGNQAREANGFYPFVPELPEPETKTESGFKIIPVLAIQVTLFPGTGICIGITNHHVIGDASSTVGFIKAWGLVSRLGRGNDGFLAENNLIPFYDRSGIKDDPSGRRANIFWNHMKLYPYGSYDSTLIPNNKVRSTFILQENEIQTLKNSVLERKPGFVHHLSSFTVVSAYVWACLVKSEENDVDENEPEYFGFAVDARHRLEPPVPAAYFGNCLAFIVAESRHGILSGKDGFLIAAELVGDLISEKVNNKEELLRDADEWLVKYAPLLGKRLFGVAGSPRFDLYDTDFGWGKPKKYESVSIDGDESMSLSKSREFEGGLEIGLSLPVKKMDTFADVFYAGLKM